MLSSVNVFRFGVLLEKEKFSFLTALNIRHVQDFSRIQHDNDVHFEGVRFIYYLHLVIIGPNVRPISLQDKG